MKRRGEALWRPDLAWESGKPSPGRPRAPAPWKASGITSIVCPSRNEIGEGGWGEAEVCGRRGYSREAGPARCPRGLGRMAGVGSEVRSGAQTLGIRVLQPFEENPSRRKAHAPSCSSLLPGHHTRGPRLLWRGIRAPSFSPYPSIFTEPQKSLTTSGRLEIHDGPNSHGTWNPQFP